MTTPSILEYFGAQHEHQKQVRNEKISGSVTIDDLLQSLATIIHFVILKPAVRKDAPETDGKGAPSAKRAKVDDGDMAAAIAAAEDGVIDPQSDEGSDGEAEGGDAEWQVRSVGVFLAISERLAFLARFRVSNYSEYVDSFVACSSAHQAPMDNEWQRIDCRDCDGFCAFPKLGSEPSVMV
jgi:hypothetical protein